MTQFRLIYVLRHIEFVLLGDSLYGILKLEKLHRIPDRLDFKHVPMYGLETELDLYRITRDFNGAKILRQAQMCHASGEHVPFLTT